MVSLGRGDVMEEADQFLTDQILREEREVLYGVEDGGIGEDGGIERMGGIQWLKQLSQCLHVFH